MSFTAVDGRIAGHYKIKGFFSRLAVVDANKFIFFRDGMKSYDDSYDEYRVCQIDSTGRLLKRWLNKPFNPGVNAGDIIASERYGNKDVLIARMFNDTIYSLMGDSLEASYKIDLQRTLIPRELSSITDQAKFASYMEEPATSYVGEYLAQTKRHIAVLIKYGATFCLLWHNKNNGRTTLTRTLVNDIDNTVLPFMRYMDDNNFVSVIDAATLQQQYNFVSKLLEFKTRFSVLIRLNEIISQDSNPVLAFVRLK